MARALCTLDDQGIITDPILKLDRLLKIFYASEESQSTFTPIGTVKSLQKIVRKHSINSDLADAVKTALRDLLNPYFDEVQLTVTLSEINTDLVEYSINVAVKVYQDGNAYDGVDVKTIKNNFVQIFE